MFRPLLFAVILGALAVGAWQLADGGAVSPAYAADLDCDDFSYQAEAQAYYRQHTADTDNLDADDDGVACENLSYLPCPCDLVPVYHTGYNNPYGYPILYGGAAPSRPSHLSLLVQKTSIACDAETAVAARVTYPNGAGAPAHLVTFQSSLGTVFTNILTDTQGYVSTKFVAPSSPATIQLTAFADGLTQTSTISVTCAGPALPPPLRAPAFIPPKTGGGGLADSNGGSGDLWMLLGAVVLFLGAPAATVAVARQRS